MGIDSNSMDLEVTVQERSKPPKIETVSVDMGAFIECGFIWIVMHSHFHSHINFLQMLVQLLLFEVLMLI